MSEREYEVHEEVRATHTFFVRARSKAQAVALVQEALDSGDIEAIEALHPGRTEPESTGRWWANRAGWLNRRTT